MIRKVLVAISVLLIYQAVAVCLLYSSDYLNVVSYYTHPPTKGEVELTRLPILFGDVISMEILTAKNVEAKKLVDARAIGMAAVLSSYEHNQFLPKMEAKHRAIHVAELFVLAGYDISQCENDGRSTASVLQDWGVFDEDMERFLRQFNKETDLLSCTTINGVRLD